MNCYDEYENKDFKLFFNYGYLVNIDNNKEIIINLKNEEIINTGLVIGIKQGDQIVDIDIVKNTDMKDIIFKKDLIEMNNNKYSYNDLLLKLESNDMYIITDNTVLFKLKPSFFDMISVIINNVIDKKYVITVLKSTLNVSCIFNDKIVWTTPVNIGSNNFDSKSSNIITKNNTYNLDECYLKSIDDKINIYVDSGSNTEIIGFINNPFY